LEVSILRTLRLAFLTLSIAALGCGSSGTSGTGGSGGTRGPDQPYAGYQSEIYQSLDPWLCHPDQDDADNVCLRDLSATVVVADGRATNEPHTPAADPAIDCFYVYPTASFDSAGNSDLEANDEEIFVVLNQAARFNSVCRVFAPVYRQVTLSVIFNDGLTGDGALAYGDVLDAFKHYIANDNEGRGFILIGHSQGSGHLTRLIQQEVEQNAVLAERMVAAYLLGTTVAVPKGADVGGTFQTTPLCRATDQIGCLVTYASWRDRDPPDSDAIFSDTRDPNTEAACVNPAALTGGKATLTPYFPGEIKGVFTVALGPGSSPYADPEAHDPIPTPYYSMPDFVQAECVARDQYSYLEISVMADPEDPRADDFNGDFRGAVGWGLHLVDVSLALGNLIALAESQSAAWSAAQD
jgi:hypothetical protein